MVARSDDLFVPLALLLTVDCGLNNLWTKKNYQLLTTIYQLKKLWTVDCGLKNQLLQIPKQGIVYNIELIEKLTGSKAAALFEVMIEIGLIVISTVVGYLGEVRLALVL